MSGGDIPEKPPSIDPHRTRKKFRFFKTSLGTNEALPAPIIHSVPRDLVKGCRRRKKKLGVKKNL